MPKKVDVLYSIEKGEGIYDRLLHRTQTTIPLLLNVLKLGALKLLQLGEGAVSSAVSVGLRLKNQFPTGITAVECC